MGAELSISTLVLWAKSGSAENPQLWENLATHLADTASISEFVWDRWLSLATKTMIARETGLNDDGCRILLVWMCAVHDIGKASPAFQAKVEVRSEVVRESGLWLPLHPPRYSHAYGGEVLLLNWLNARGWNGLISAQCASVIGGHHGTNPNDETINHLAFEYKYESSSVFGNPDWHQVQQELLEWAFEKSGASNVESAIKSASLPPCIQMLYTGLVIMCDWISSNAELFPLQCEYAGWDQSASRAHNAWESLRLPVRFDVGLPAHGIDQLFRRRFRSLPEDALLRPTQQSALELTQNMDQPGILIIEDVMGGGKTEASLLCAEILMSKFGMDGIAYLLPTQATSNAMFSRVKKWLSSLVEDQGRAGQQGLILAHGKAALNEEYASLPKWGSTNMGDDSRDGDAIIAHQWFCGNKRSLLSPFVVGTVDQLLMAALKVKHVHLRHLGLAGKVVIIDEVHAYDAYMSVYLDRVLAYLGKYQVPVILLSATLPHSRRALLLDSYRGVRKARRAASRSHMLSSSDGFSCDAYPLVTRAYPNKESKIVSKTPSASTVSRRINVSLFHDDDESLVDLLTSSLAEGGCVCVLRNTVRRAQDTYELVKSRLGVKVLMAHARFVAVDRASNDQRLVDLLGFDQSQRPRSLVVVGTQVLEQSLDVDFDLMITDVAPIDLLLQRMGRLHRHSARLGRRPKPLSEATCYITGVSSWENGLPQFDRGCASVYEPSLLYRTLASLHLTKDGDTTSVELPVDIASLVEQTYEREVAIPSAWEPDVWQATCNEDKHRQQLVELAGAWLLPKAPRKTLHGLMRSMSNITDDVRGRAAVRNSEESIEVVLVRDHAGTLEVLPWVAERMGVDPCLGTGAEVPNDATARAAACCSVALPYQLCIPGIADAVIEWLERQRPLMGWFESCWLRDALPLAIDDSGEAVIDVKDRTFHIRYSRSIGLSLL